MSEGLPERAAVQPPWLDVALVQRAVLNAGERSPVASIAVTCPLAAGENYASVIYRVEASLADGRQRSFIVKGPVEAGAMEAMFEEARGFEREVLMLTDVIPKMEALLEAAAPGRFPPLAPRCRLHGTSPVPFLVLDDLSPAGFRCADRVRGLGLRHSLLALRALARFHAASHALLRRQPQLLRQLHSGLKSSNQSLQDYVRGELQALAAGCRAWPGFEQHAQRLEAFQSVAGTVFDKLNEANPDAFNVINHGDFWVNNMMYRYEDGAPKEFRAVDLQLARAASPALDVLHVCASSLSGEVYAHHRAMLLREYHCELHDTLALLGHQAPPLEALEATLDAHGAYALFVSLELPIIRAEAASDLDALSQGHYDGYLRRLHSPGVKALMQPMLREYARKGWLPA